MSNRNHDEGQTDASNGEYSPPHSLGSELTELFLGSTQSYSRVLQENAEYREGWHHGESQKR